MAIPCPERTSGCSQRWALMEPWSWARRRRKRMAAQCWPFLRTWDRPPRRSSSLHRVEFLLERDLVRAGGGEGFLVGLLRLVFLAVGELGVGEDLETAGTVREGLHGCFGVSEGLHRLLGGEEDLRGAIERGVVLGVEAGGDLVRVERFVERAERGERLGVDD